MRWAASSSSSGPPRMRNPHQLQKLAACLLAHLQHGHSADLSPGRVAAWFRGAQPVTASSARWHEPLHSALCFSGTATGICTFRPSLWAGDSAGRGTLQCCRTLQPCWRIQRSQLWQPCMQSHMSSQHLLQKDCRHQQAPVGILQSSSTWFSALVTEYQQSASPLPRASSAVGETSDAVAKTGAWESNFLQPKTQDPVKRISVGMDLH